MPWYTTPAALALIDSVTERPAVHFGTDALGGHLVPSYEIPAGLHALWIAAAKEALRYEPFEEKVVEAVLVCTPHAVMAAIWGSAGYLDDDDHNVWPTIRAELAGARMQVAA